MVGQPYLRGVGYLGDELSFRGYSLYSFTRIYQLHVWVIVLKLFQSRSNSEQYKSAWGIWRYCRYTISALAISIKSRNPQYLPLGYIIVMWYFVAFCSIIVWLISSRNTGGSYDCGVVCLNKTIRDTCLFYYNWLTLLAMKTEFSVETNPNRTKNALILWAARESASMLLNNQ